MKTIKSLTEAEIAELPTLPDEWKWARLGELVHEIVVGYVGPITQYLTDNQNNGVRFLSTTHIGNNQFLNNKEIRYVTNEFSMKNKKSEVLAGDIIVARHGDSGKCCIIPPSIKKAQVSNAVIIRPNNELFVNLYLVYSFGYLKQSLQKKKVGGVQQVVNTKTMETFPFPLPPLPEQRAIVSKIELLFSELDNGIANLKLAQEQLKVYRQAVLKKAFEGELTKKWREQQTDLPDARDLLEQIRKGREKTANATGKKVKSVKSLIEEELEGLPRLPEEWYWVKNEELIHYVTSGSRDWKQFYSEKGAYFIRTQDIKTNSLALEEVAFVDLPDKVEGKRSLVEEDDLLMTITGANVGKVAHINFEIPEAYVSQSVALMKYVDKRIVPFLHYYFQTHGFGATFISKLVYGMGRPVLSLENMREVPVPLCSLKEQKQIIQEIETRLSVCDKIEQDIETNLEKAEALRQSILKKAFEGKLLNEKELAEVRRAEDWEPAEVLLEKIKAEREGNGKWKKQIPEQSKKIIRDEKGLTQQATLRVFEQIDN